TPLGLITSRSRSLGPASSTTTRWDTLPAVQTTSSQRGSSACSAATTSRVRATASCTAVGWSVNAAMVGLLLVWSCSSGQARMVRHEWSGTVGRGRDLVAERLYGGPLHVEPGDVAL